MVALKRLLCVLWWAEYELNGSINSLPDAILVAMESWSVALPVFFYNAFIETGRSVMGMSNGLLGHQYILSGYLKT